MTAGFAGEKLHTYDAPAGMLVISPANAESSLTWTSTRENIALAISPESLTELAIQEFDRDRVNLPILPFGTIDPIALKLAELLKAELARNEQPNELLVDSLITVFGLHLLRTHAQLRSGTPTRARGGLSVADARRVQDYVQENFSRKLAVAELSSLCNLSPGHFIQAFTKTFGEPPHRRLVNLRLDFAEKLLVETDMTIAEVAYLSGFSSQSHLTSAMRRYRQVTPALVRLRR
jgi:AraC family transcriptional regulator